MTPESFNNLPVVLLATAATPLDNLCLQAKLFGAFQTASILLIRNHDSDSCSRDARLSNSFRKRSHVRATARNQDSDFDVAGVQFSGSGLFSFSPGFNRVNQLDGTFQEPF